MKERNKNVQNDSAFEYAFEEVPQNKRKNLLSLMIVLAGYPIALSNFVVGGAVGVGLSFSNAILALLFGNLLLISLVILTGLIAFKTGLSTAFLSKRAFGKVGSYLFSIMLALSAVTWVSLNGDIFSRLVKSTFEWWFIPVPVTAVIVIMMWLLSAYRGYKGLAFVSYLGVPAALILSFYGVYKVAVTTDGFSGVLSYVPNAPITFTAATASIVGGWIFGATVTPDVCRFAKRKLHVFIAGLIAFIVGCFAFQLSGALIAISTGEGDFTLAMAALGMGIVAFFTAVFCLWTTQDNNIYGASLALQNIIKDSPYYGKIKHKHVAVLIAGLAAIFAASGIYEHIMPITQFLSFLIAPVPGIIIAEEYFVKKPKQHIYFNKTAIIAWILGGFSGYIALKFNFLIPPFVGIIVAAVSFILLEKLIKTEVKIETMPTEKASSN